MVTRVQRVLEMQSRRLALFHVLETQAESEYMLVLPKRTPRSYKNRVK